MTEPHPLVHRSLAHAHVDDVSSSSEFWTKALSGEDIRQAYFGYREDVPLDGGVVFYETMSGDRMNDNPFAIFKYLRSHPEYGSFLHVWSLGEHGTIPDEYADAEDVVFARRGSRAYAYYLASAGHIICNAILPEFLTRRDGQQYLNTWHGIPYKALGRNAARARFGSPTGLGTFLKATHVLTPCEFMTDALVESYSMAGASTAVIAETGYPRVDLTVDPTPGSVSALRQTLGLDDPRDGGQRRPVVAYAPTWRSEGGSDTVDIDQLVGDLEALAALDIQLVYRGHHRVARFLTDAAVGGRVGHIIVPPQDLSSNELLAAVDVLITDYSSIFFDFLPLGRPIIHYVYDLDDYATARGLNLTADELPGVIASDRGELVEAVRAASDALRALPADTNLANEPLQGDRYREGQSRFAPLEDGRASERAVRWFFGADAEGISVREPRDGRPTIVFWAGCLSDDQESREFVANVLRFARSPHYQATMIVDRAATFDREQLKAIKSLKRQLSCIAYDEQPPTVLPSEAEAHAAFAAAEAAGSRDVWRRIRRDSSLTGLFAREYRRRLDDARFDALVLGPNLPPHELALAAFACPNPFTVGRARKFRPMPAPPLTRAVDALFPPGSRRRSRARHGFRSLRARVAR